MTARRSLIALISCASLFGQLKLPPYTRTVLPNGVVVDLLPRTGVPLVINTSFNDSEPIVCTPTDAIVASPALTRCSWTMWF